MNKLDPVLRTVIMDQGTSGFRFHENKPCEYGKNMGPIIFELPEVRTGIYIAKSRENNQAGP